MFKSYILSKNTLAVLFGALVISACSEDSNSIFDPDWTGEPDPVITELVPASSAYAGVGSVTVNGLEPITIFGENFGTNPDRVIVYFGTSRAEIVELNDDVIKVIPPDNPGESLVLRVVKIGAEKYDEKPYQLRSIFQDYPGFEGADEPRAITTDFNGELLAANYLSGAINGIIRMNREGEREQVVNPDSWSYYKIQHGPDQAIYKVRGGTIPIIYRTGPGESSPQIIVGPQNTPRIQDIEFDQHGNLWAGGENGATANAVIIRVDIATNSSERFPFIGNIRALRVYDGYLYVGASRAGENISGVWRLPINPDHTLGDEELYLEMPSVDDIVRDIIFTAGGDMVIATNTIESVMIFRNNQLQELYPGVLPHGARDFAVSSIDPTQLIVNLTELSIDNVTSDYKILIVEMEQELVPIYGTYN